MSNTAAGLPDDPKELLPIVLEAVTDLCDESSSVPILRLMAERLKENGASSKLEASVIEEGKTNISFRVFINKGNHHAEEEEELAIYAKVCFPYARWNSAKALYDLGRVDNEFWIMREFRQLLPTRVIAEPYHVLSLPSSSSSSSSSRPEEEEEPPPQGKLLITEWLSQANTQWSQQFINSTENSIDDEIIPELARTLGLLNGSGIDLVPDKDFNRSGDTPPNNFDGMMHLFQAKCCNSKDKDNYDNDDVCVKSMKKTTQSTFLKLLESMAESSEQREVLCHNDMHVFNILVPSSSNNNNNNNNNGNGNTGGKFYICDWEMSGYGAKGIDPGKLTFFPLVCAMHHAAHGRETIARHIVQLMETFWDDYAKALVQQWRKRNNSGSDNNIDTTTINNNTFNYYTEEEDQRLASICKNCFGWTGFYLFVIVYLFGMFQESIPTDEVISGNNSSWNAREEALASAGYIGLRLMHYGFGSDDDDEIPAAITTGKLAQMRNHYHKLIMTRVERLLTTYRK